MKKKISKFIFLFVLPAIALSMVVVLFATNFVGGHVVAEEKFGGAFRVEGKSTISIDGETSLSKFTATNGGAVWVDTNATFQMTNGTISENAVTKNGGGVCNTGTFTMTDGTISNNTASEKGNNIYNSGTFTMNGGVVGVAKGSTEEETEDIYGIYNTGTMTLSSGTVYDNIYSSASFTTTPNATLSGTITLGDDAQINVTNYNGITPNYTIALSDSRANGTILTFRGSTTQPNLENINILGDLSSLSLRAEQSSTDETLWTVKLVCTLTLSAETGVSKFSVTIDGTTTNHTSYSNVLDYRTSVTVSISSLYAGYNGGYWKENRTAISSSSSTIIVEMTSNRTLTACASGNRYYVQYNGNGSTGGSMANSTHQYGTSSRLSDNNFSKSNHSFNGWNTKADGTGTSYSNQQYVSTLTTTYDDIFILYAQWKANTFTVAFDQSGGTGGQTLSITMTYGERYSSKVSVPTKNGYYFDGYYYGNVQYFDSSGICLKTCEFTEENNSTIEMTAKWTKIDKNFIRVDQNGNESEDGKYVLFGSYPQSKASDAVKIALNLGNGSSTADGYYTYNGSTYIKHNGEYYCVEPVKWKIVRESKSQGLMTLVSESILDASIFNVESDTRLNDNKYYYYNTNSSLADKVESDLINAGIFDSNDQKLLFYGDRDYWNVELYYKIYSLESTANGNKYTYSSHIRVPSYEECVDANRGIQSSAYSDSWFEDYNSNNKNCFYYGFETKKTATDYAKAMGCTNDFWWTMTGCGSSNYGAWYVDATGSLACLENYNSITTTHGVVPLINISTEFLMSCGHIMEEQVEEVVSDSSGCYTKYIKICSNSLCPNHKQETSSDIVIVTDSYKSHDDSCKTSIGPWTAVEGTNNHSRTISCSCSQCNYSWTKTETEVHQWGTETILNNYFYDEDPDGYHYQISQVSCSYCGGVKKQRINEGKHSMYPTTGSPVNYSSTKHSITTTRKCSNINCDYSYIDKIEYVDHSYNTEISCTYEASNNTEHTVIKTMQCSCSAKTTKSETHTTKSQTYYESASSTQHQKYTNYVCSESCGYRTDPVAVGVLKSHDTLGPGGSCSLCYYGALMFLPSGEYLECINCDEHENVLNCQCLISSLKKNSYLTFEVDLLDEQEILLEDKKKSGTLFIDKRYMSNGYEAKNFQI